MQTFRVEIFAGHRVVSMFFGRLDISEEALAVRAQPAWMLKPRTAPRDTIQRVQVRHRRFTEVITIEDTGGVFTNININAQLTGYPKVQAQLEGCGYVITDRH